MARTPRPFFYSQKCRIVHKGDIEFIIQMTVMGYTREEAIDLITKKIKSMPDVIVDFDPLYIISNTTSGVQMTKVTRDGAEEICI